MPQVGIFILVHIFSALLPPIDPDESDFYQILGLERGATVEEIRKAYKKKSLALHPDKVAQRRQQNQEEAAAEYERVQEAYGVLVNDEKRARYHALQCSVQRFKFIQRGALTNPGALLENLASSTFVDKTRLVALCSVICAILWIQPVLIATKINHVLENRGNLEDTKWVVILLPYFVLHALLILFWFVIFVLVSSPARLPVLLTAFEQLTWFVGIIRLARAWDGAFPEDHPYKNILIPVYVAMVLRWVQAIATLYKVRQDILRMITIDYLEKEVLKGKSVEDLSEEEREDIMKSFLLVTVPPDFEPITDTEGGDAVELDEKVIEEQKVAASPEFDAATGIYNTTFGNLVSSVIFGSVFLILLTRKLDGKIEASWWAVFTPIWVFYGSLIVYYTHSCMCGSISGEEVVLTLRKQEQEQAGKDGGDNGENNGNGSNMPPDKDKVDSNGNETEISPDDPRQKSADNFVNPEDSARKFNRPKHEASTSSDDKNVPDEEKFEDVKLDNADNATASSDTKAHSTDEDKKSDDGKNDGGQDEEHIHLDEESFRAFQSAYAEAEENAMQEQAKASTNCCGTCFQLLLLCLVVAKLDKAYENDDPDDVGFNTFWILFPLLLIFGLGCCICSCLIYGANGELSDMMDQEGGEEDGQEHNNHGGDEEAPASPIIPLAPPPANAASQATTTQEASTTASDSVVDSTNLVSVTSVNQSGSNASAMGNSLPADSTMESVSATGSSLPLPISTSEGGAIDDLD